MKKYLIFIGLLMGSVALVGCGSDGRSDAGKPDSSNVSGIKSAPNNNVENSGKSLLTLHVDSASDLYGHTIKSGKNKTVVTHRVDCSGHFKKTHFVDGENFAVLGAQGDTINVDIYGIDFKIIDRNGEDMSEGLLFKNKTQDIVVGKTNYAGFVDFNVISITKNASCDK